MNRSLSNRLANTIAKRGQQQDHRNVDRVVATSRHSRRRWRAILERIVEEASVEFPLFEVAKTVLTHDSHNRWAADSPPCNLPPQLPNRLRTDDSCGHNKYNTRNTNPHPDSCERTKDDQQDSEDRDKNRGNGVGCL